MNVRPLRDQLIVRRDEAKSETEGGLIIPENAKLKSRHGEVLAVGPGRLLKNGDIRPLDVKVGDRVYFRGTHGVEVDIKGETLVLLREDEIDGIVEGA